MHIIKYSKYPNNEIRAVHYYKASPRAEQGANSSESPPCPVSGGTVWVEPEAQEVASPSLDISSKLGKSGYGETPKRTKFGSRAKNTLLRAGGALDTMQGKPHHYVMLTGTLPGGTPAAMKAMMDWSAWITNACTKWITNNTKSEYYFYVWELQARGALHIHLCVYLPDTYERCWVLWNWWDKWMDIIQGVASRAGCEMWQRADGSYHRGGKKVLQADAQQVYSSVAAYLSGYCGGSKDKHKKDTVHPYYPTRWWGYSRALSKLLKGLTEQYEIEHANYRDARYEIQAHYEQVLSDSPKAHHYQHKVGIGSTVVSYHPEDKAKKSWHPEKNPMYNQRVNPNTSSLILHMRLTIPTIVSYLKLWANSKPSVLKPLFRASEDLISLNSLSRYTLHQKDLALYRVLILELCLLQQDSQTLVKMQQRLKGYVRWLDSEPILPPSDSHGWYLNTSDIPCTVDRILSFSDTGTSEGENPDSTTTAEEPRYVQIPLLPES